MRELPLVLTRSPQTSQGAGKDPRGPAWEVGEERGWASTSTTAAAGPTKAYRSPPSRESQQLGKKQAVSTKSHARGRVDNQCVREKYMSWVAMKEVGKFAHISFGLGPQESSRSCCYLYLQMEV